MKLTNILFASVVAPVIGSMVEKPKFVFPKKIGNYKYKKRFDHDSLSNRYVFAIYENENGKKAIAKAWSGKVKDLGYYTLKNELIVLKSLSSVLERVDKSIPDKYSKIHIPPLLGYVETKRSLIILKEFVYGTNATSLSTSEKFEVYSKSNDFLKHLGQNLTETEKGNISKRTVLNIVILYPHLLVKALFTNYRMSLNLIRGIPPFLKSIPLLLKRKSQTLGDRDLVLNNILISGEGIYLIDLQLSMFSDPLYDALYRTCAQWDQDDLRLLLLDQIKNLTPLQGKDQKTLIKGFMVHVATHSLTGGDLSKKVIQRNLAFLNLAIGKSFELAYE